MAGGARLTRGTGRRLLALLAIVLLLHAIALPWLAHQLEQPSVLRPLPTPMFTRVLRQEALAAIAVQPVSTVRRVKRRRAVVAASVAPAAAPAASAAGPPLPEPPRAPPIPPAQAVAAEKAASAPAPAASVATASASASAAGTQTQAGLDGWPADTRLNYRLGGQFRSGELHGSARVQWQRQGERYETRIEIDVTLLAALVLTSQGEVTAQGLSPRAYEELRRSGPRSARLEDDNIVLNDGQRVPRPPGVQDTASQFVELSHRFATGQAALEVGRSVSFWLARPGGVDEWTYDIVARETLRSPELGAIDAFHLKPRPIANPRGNITAEMWFAPSLQYLPVRIRVGMGGDTHVDLMVEKIEQR